MNSRKIVAGAAAAVAGTLLAVLWAPAALPSAASAGASAPSSLDDVVLAAHQVGPGYAAGVLLYGRQLSGHSTLGFCGNHPQSDAMRTARLDVGYVKLGNAPHVENEVVAYRQEGAALALSEARQLPKVCPAASRKATKPTDVTGFRIAHVRLRNLPQHALALELTIHMQISKRRVVVHTIIVFEAQGDLLSVLYVTPHDNRRSRALAVHVARQSALNLKRASTSPPGPSYPACAEQVQLTLTPAEGPSPTPATLSFSQPAERWDGFYLYEGNSLIEDGGGSPSRLQVLLNGSPGAKIVFTLVRAYTNVDIIEPTCIAGTATFTITG